VFKNPDKSDIQDVTNLIHKIKRVSSSNGEVSSKQLATITKQGSRVYFTRIDDVYLFLMELFADYNHDFGPITGINKKLENELNTHPNINCRGVNGTHERMLSFRKWICRIRWLNNSIKPEILSLIDSGTYQEILIESFGSRAEKIKEDVFAKGVFEKYMLHGDVNQSKENLPFIVLGSDGIYDARGAAGSRISFDQSSRSSAPQAFAAFKKGHKIDVALPFLADKGASQTSNPLIDFFGLIREYLMTKKESGKRDGILNQLSKFVINDNDTFPIQFYLNGQVFFRYEYSYDRENINLKFHTFGNNQNMIGEAMSAENIKHTNTSHAIFKTATDLGMQMYSISANSIFATGDRAAGTIMMTLFFMWSKGLIKFDNGSVFPRFVFEVTTSDVLVPYDKYFKMITLQNKNGIIKNNEQSSVYKNYKNRFVKYVSGLSSGGRITQARARSINTVSYGSNTSIQYPKTVRYGQNESLGPAPGGNNNGNEVTSKPSNIPIAQSLKMNLLNFIRKNEKGRTLAKSVRTTQLKKPPPKTPTAPTRVSSRPKTVINYMNVNQPLYKRPLSVSKTLLSTKRPRLF
jgi:hypothetical protein